MLQWFKPLHSPGLLPLQPLPSPALVISEAGSVPLQWIFITSLYKSASLSVHFFFESADWTQARPHVKIDSACVCAKSTVWIPRMSSPSVSQSPATSFPAFNQLAQHIATPWAPWSSSVSALHLPLLRQLPFLPCLSRACSSCHSCSLSMLKTFSRLFISAPAGLVLMDSSTQPCSALPLLCTWFCVFRLSSETSSSQKARKAFYSSLYPSSTFGAYKSLLAWNKCLPLFLRALLWNADGKVFMTAAHTKPQM